MKRRAFKKQSLAFPILMFFVTMVLIVIGSNLFTTPMSESFTQLDTGWSVHRGLKSYDNVRLSQFKLGKTEYGETIKITNTLPKMDVIAPTIMFKSNLSSVRVHVDKKYVYSFGTEYNDVGQFVPKKYNLITLEDSSTEHEIEITYAVAENNAFNGFFPIYYGAKRNLVQYFLQSHRLSILVGAFLIVYAFLLVSMGIFLWLYRGEDITVFIIAGVSLLFGIYTFGYNDVFSFLNDNYNFYSQMEYFSLYLIPFSISLLLYVIHPDIAKNRQRIILGINFAMPVIFWLSARIGITHIDIFVTPVQIVMALEIIIILPALLLGMYMENKKKRESSTYTGIDADNYLLLGFIFLIIFGFLEILKYTFRRYNVNAESKSVFANTNYLTLGILFFIICLFIYYFLNGIDHMNANKVKKHLEGLAYTDALTGLMNRAKCMQYAAALEGEYAVVSLDLDRLKYVNDTFGHLEGDRMIKSFSEMLEKAFEGASLIGRTGGDEFLVIFENPEEGICDRCIDKLQKNMQEFNQTGENFTLSASAGYAYSNEGHGTYDDVFFMADTRMYEMKEKHHA